MLKIEPIDSQFIKLMPYNNNEDTYITDLHRKVSEKVLDDVERYTFSDFKQRIKQFIEADTVGWVVWLKEPVAKVGIIYFSHVVPGISAMLHLIFDMSSYKAYLKSSHKPIEVTKISIAMAIGYLFKKFNLQRITGMYFDYNTPMINLCREIGFKNEGLIRRGTRVNGVPTNYVILGLLKDELTNPRAQ